MNQFKMVLNGQHLFSQVTSDDAGRAGRLASSRTTERGGSVWVRYLGGDKASEGLVHFAE